MTYALSDLALIAMRRGGYGSAEAVSRRLVEIRAKAWAADPVNRRALEGPARGRSRLASVLQSPKKLAAAEAECREVLRLRQHMIRLSGPEPANLVRLADAEACLAELLLDQAEAGEPRKGQRLQEALRLLCKANAVAAVKANAAWEPSTPPFVLRVLRRAERRAGGGR